MDMIVTFPGGVRVDAQFGPHTIRTDQPLQGGGEGSAPTPFALFALDRHVRWNLRPGFCGSAACRPTASGLCNGWTSIHAWA